MERIAEVTALEALARGIVARAEGGELIVELEGGEQVACDVLRAGDHAPSAFLAGDRVLIAQPSRPGGRGCVLGVIEDPAAPRPAPLERRIAAGTIVLEARESLEIRVKDSRIVITADGKILVHGDTVVSRARGLNAVRGAAVRIN